MNHFQTNIQNNIYFDLVANFKSFIFKHMTLKAFGKLNMPSYVVLKTGNSVIAQHKPAEKCRKDIRRGKIRFQFVEQVSDKMEQDI